MRQKPGPKRSHGEKIVKDIRRATRKHYSAEKKIRIVLVGLMGDAAPGRRLRKRNPPRGTSLIACSPWARI